MTWKTSRQWLEILVAFDTVSRNPNLALIEYVRDALATQGIEAQVIASPAGDKANLFATLPASDGNTQGGVVLSGHSDVVPVDGQQWESDPFTLTERAGRLYGRGSCDMKGFLAVALSLVPEWLHMPRNKPLHLAFSYDEEVGCLGAPVLLHALQQQGQQFDGCVVGEPTSMQVVVAHKGIHVYRCRVHGKAAHSSLTPQGSNAIEYAARLICRIRDVADQLREQGPYDTCFDVPFTTMGTNTIHGGNAINTIPQYCEFGYEFRNLPGVAAQDIQSQVERYVQAELLPRMQRECAQARIDFERIASVPALDEAESAAITALARALTGDTQKRKVAFATEAGMFAQAGIPTVICGPGDIAVAHAANEYVEISQLEACAVFLRKLAAAL